MRKSITAAIAIMIAFATMGDDCQSEGEKAAREESAQQGAAYRNILRNQPPPSFDFSFERKVLIELYKARQNAVATYTYIQSEYTGKVLWSCPSVGFPIPYSTQLTNPDQVVYDVHSNVTLPQNEPNGLFPPASSEATLVPCVDEDGNITPVYEEKRATAFFRPMIELGGVLVPKSSTDKATLQIKK